MGQQIDKNRQLSFGNMHKEVSRLEAMKIAKEQALVREMAAEYAKDGQHVPESALIERYKKTIDKKLGPHGSRQTKAPTVAAPAAAPVAVAPEQIQPPWWPQAQAQASPQSDNIAPIFCSKHDATEKRKKIAPRNATCSRCKEVVQTNYAEFSICHTCSRHENRCLCCGETVGAPQQQHQDLGQGAALYCSRHDQSGKRKKTQPRNVECSSCKTSIQSNYVDFMLCAPCSQAEQRCLCCGTSTCTHMASAPQPSTVSGLFNPCVGAGFPNVGSPPLQGLQLPNPAMNQMPALNPLASQNILASFNHVASANRMMPQRVF